VGEGEPVRADVGEDRLVGGEGGDSAGGASPGGSAVSFTVTGAAQLRSSAQPRTVVAVTLRKLARGALLLEV
jgi:hypothetical protein